MKISRNWANNTNFLAIFQRFSDYTLLRPMSYALDFWEIKSSIKMYNRGEIYWYTIFCFQVINFQGFSYQFSIHEMTRFGKVLGHNSPKYCQIELKIFNTCTIQGNKNSTLRIFEKLKSEIPRVCTFGQTLAIFFRGRWPKLKKRILEGRF